MDLSSLTGTRDLGIAVAPLRRALALLAEGRVRSLGGDPRLARALGLGTAQADSLGAWMRLAGLVRRSSGRVHLSPLGSLIQRWDEALEDLATWWVLHWELSSNYVVWSVLGLLGQRRYELAELEELIGSQAGNPSPRTLQNARRSLISTLRHTPLGQQLGLVQLETDGKTVKGLTKLAVRHGQAPLAAVAYAVLDWARRQDMRSASLETLAGREGPGTALHMSPGVLERYLLEIDAVFRGQVLSYSYTAGLNEAYFKEVPPLQVLAAHYIRRRHGLEWPEALEQAAGELGHAHSQ